jgi:hypothetical protein
VKNKKAVVVFSLMAVAVFGITALAWLSARHQQPDEDTSGIRTLIPTDVLPRENAILRWTPGPSGTTYDVDVVTTDLKPVARGSNLAVPEYRIPPESFLGLTPGRVLGWTVTAHFPDGRKATSPTFRNRMKKK